MTYLKYFKFIGQEQLQRRARQVRRTRWYLKRTSKVGTIAPSQKAEVMR